MATVNKEELKRLRDLKGVKQEEVANELERKLNKPYPLSTYASKEKSGKFKLDDIKILGNYFGVDPEQLMLGSTPKKEDSDSNLNDLRQMISTFLERNLAVQEVLLEYLAKLKETTVEEEDANVGRKVNENRKKYSKKGNR